MFSFQDLAGRDDIEAAQIDALADFLRDMQYEYFAPYMFVVQGYDEGDKVSVTELRVIKETFCQNRVKLGTKKKDVSDLVQNAFLGFYGVKNTKFGVRFEIYLVDSELPYT